MENPDQSEWVPAYLLMKAIQCTPEYITPYISVLMVIQDMISDLELSTHTELTGVLSFEWVIFYIHHNMNKLYVKTRVCVPGTNY